MDILIHGGVVHDGTQAPSRPADLLIRDGAIRAVIPPGQSDGVDAQRIDATGQIVAPGFIDVHTHSDVSLLLDPRAESKVHQGVTTEIIGNCGFSPFPVNPTHRQDHADLLAGIGDDPYPLTWSDLDGYGEEFARRGVAVNAAPLVGHGQLRIAAQGVAQEESTDDTVAAMQQLLAQQLEQGAFGLSTGLTYVPSRFADRGELTALCRTLAEFNAVYTTHSRGEGSSPVDEAAQLGRATGARVQYSHVAINVPARWGTAGETVSLFDRAREQGVDIAYDLYPYDASASALTQYLPPWVQSGGIEAMAHRLSDAAAFARAASDVAQGWGAGIPWLWDRVVLARTDGLCDARAGLSIADAAAELGVSEPELVLRLCQLGGNRVQVVLFYRTEEDMREFLRQPYALIGSDGSAIPYDQAGRMPHPRAFGAHARLLGRYVRETGVLALDDAIRRSTGAAAERFGLRDRGVLRNGAAADVVVFDPETVLDQATFLAPNQPPIGVAHVLVNGNVVVAGGRETSARPGRLLRAR